MFSYKSKGQRETPESICVTEKESSGLVWLAKESTVGSMEAGSKDGENSKGKVCSEETGTEFAVDLSWQR